MAVVLEPLPAVLDRRHLHVFVSGPGEGESIAVALPDRGWFLVDGCYVQVDGVDQYPALVAYERWKAVDDPVEALAWTHPHADHFDGIRETIERFPPRRVGVVVAEQPEPGSMCLESAAFAQHPLLPIDVRLRDVFNRVLSTFESIRGRWEADPTSVWLLRDGSLDVGRTTIDVLFPTDPAIRTFYADPKLQERLATRANELSAVVRLRFGATTVLLGGDLPVRQGRRELRHGWPDVLASWPAAHEHGLGKVPHHGSIEAVESSAFGPAGGELVVTPYVKRRLPQPKDGDGLSSLLAGRAAVRMTADGGLLQASLHGAEVARSELRDRLAHRSAPLTSGRSVASPRGALDTTWGFALDEEGRLQGLFAGAGVLSVVERFRI